MKRKFTFLLTALLLMFSYAGLAQVVSDSTYSTPSVTGLPEGWSGNDGGGTNYIKLIAADHYIQTAEFEQNGFTSITIKARKFGGPTATQAQISVSWYDSEDIETVLGTIDPANTTLSNYTINAPTAESGNGYIKIQCKGASANKGAGVSEVKITYTEPGGTTPITYTVTYNANVTGIDPIVDVYTEGAEITLRPSTTFTYEGHTFSEWNTQADGDGDAYEAGDIIEDIQNNIELYAIWTENPVSDEQWVLTSLADLASTDVFVIVSTKGNANHAMSNDKGASSAPTAVSVTIANDQITSTVASTIQWTGITGNATDGYIIYSNADNSKYLYCINNNNGVRVGSGSDSTFIIKDNYIYNVGQGRYLGVYNNADWRSYTSINNNISGQTFAFYKKVSGGVIPPSISADNVEIAYDATVGSIAYTINNSVEGGTVSAAVTEGDWLTLGEGTTSPIQFTCSANAAGIERTATVTLTYTYDRATVTKNITVSQAGNPNATMTIAEVRAQGTGLVATTGIVTSCVGTTGYIQDATAAICVYGAELTVGDEIRVSGSLSTYKGLLEITNPVVTVLSNGNTVEPTLKTIAEINADDITSPNSIQGLYVTIENATVTVIDGQNTTIAQGTNTIVVRNIPSTVTYTVNDILTLDGNIGCYNVAQIVNPQNVQVQVAPVVPSITVNPGSINAPVEGVDGSLVITYQNIPDLIAFDIQFCDSLGNELEGDDPDWIYAEITEPSEPEGNYTVSYIIDSNTGEARTAYFTVYTFTGEELDEVHSNLITISQDEYVAPTFAELPFEFDGGKAAIDTIDGLYQEGLGNDYSNSPKLRFDDTGDWLVLQFSEVPGKLSFNIKGNSFSQGSTSTFKVQVSENGITYSDLAVYNTLGSTQPEEFDLNEDVRYVKWIYTEKGATNGGNVALGKIKLLKPATMYSLTVEPFENLEIFTFVGGNESEVALEGEGTIQVAEDDQVMLSISANEGYEIQSLMVDGVEHVNDIAEDMTYTFNMPGHNVTISATAVEATPPTPPTGDEYVLYTGELVEGDYVICYHNSTWTAAMKNTVENGRLSYEEVIPNDNGVITTDDATIVWHIAPNDEGYWTIFSADANAYAASTGVKNKAQMLEDGTDDMAMWSDSLTEYGTYEFVNKYNAAANVNAYLRNNDTYGFACYATNIGGALSLYKKVEQTTITQAYELTEGWNWVSFNIVADPVELLDMVKAALGDNALQIESFDDGGTVYLGDGEWFGDLDETGVDNKQMYLIEIETGCTIELEGMPADPSGIEITIYPGWNWIGYPYSEELPISDLFSAFEASEEDVVEGLLGQSMYLGGEWLDAGLVTLIPGEGFMYFYNGEEEQTLVYQIPAKSRAASVIPVHGVKPVVFRSDALVKTAKVSGIRDIKKTSK